MTSDWFLKDFPKCGDASTHFLSDYNKISVSFLDGYPEGSRLVSIRSGFKRYPQTIDYSSGEREAGGGEVAGVCRCTAVPCTVIS